MSEKENWLVKVRGKYLFYSGSEVATEFQDSAKRYTFDRAASVAAVLNSVTKVQWELFESGLLENGCPPTPAFSRAQLENMFTYHKPFGDQADRYTDIRAGCLHMALLINNLAPDSAEKTQAIRRLQEVMMWANASIAVNEVESNG